MDRFKRFDVDFSLAMHNRTGKYFIGRDLIDCASDLLGKTYYWRVKRESPPQGFLAKLICKLQGAQIKLNAVGGFLGYQLRTNFENPILHLEPYTVLGARLRRVDAVIVHDIGPVTHPELFDPSLHKAYKKIFAEIAEVGPNLIYVSVASQREFERVYPHCRAASSHILYPAIRTDIAGRAQEPVDGLASPFLLTTGSFGHRKNQARAIDAFGRSGLAERGVRYVLCGPREPGFEVVREAAKRTDGVILLSYVSNAQLAWLYAHAVGFVLPSLLEGFGIPLAEAIDHGVVPLVTANSVLEEVAGEGALTCDALEPASIAEGMVRLIDMGDIERETRLKLLRSAVLRFTLEKFRKDWRSVLQEIGNATS